MKLKSGKVRTLSIYTTNEQEYIDKPHLGIYSWKHPPYNMGGKFDKYYLYITLNDAFGITSNDAFDAYKRGKNIFSILPEYNGSAKAISMEFWGDNKNPRSRVSYPLKDPDHFIPKTRIAERAEDVRYIVALFMESVKDGSWYNPRTGKHVSDSYNHSIINIRIYDLVNRETTSLPYSSDLVDQYFSNVE